ncbi:interleukin-36 receptor antagonist protein-like isoform X2 [Pelodiscus sinensis]|uniref:interleukin-36 receptor antagonist protein-like isoform X2 n=1 Tax=Pelodiscus sinensis TaxID=13735 RepID=UPI003F6C6D24
MEPNSHSVVDPDMEELFSTFLDEDQTLVQGGEESCVVGGHEKPERRPEKRPFRYRIRDTSHKAFYLQGSSLLATNLQGENASQEEKISVVPNRSLERKRCPLILGIKEGSRSLSCGAGEQPQLQLEDTPVIELFQQDGENTRFTFYKSFNGSTHRFEAAARPGWFLCTSDQADQPISLTDQPGQAAIVDFHFQRN